MHSPTQPLVELRPVSDGSPEDEEREQADGPVEPPPRPLDGSEEGGVPLTEPLPVGILAPPPYAQEAAPAAAPPERVPALV